jgi:hypothetical protein
VFKRDAVASPMKNGNPGLLPLPSLWKCESPLGGYCHFGVYLPDGLFYLVLIQWGWNNHAGSRHTLSEEFNWFEFFLSEPVELGIPFYGPGLFNGVACLSCST